MMKSTKAFGVTMIWIVAVAIIALLFLALTFYLAGNLSDTATQARQMLG